jgi:hypothetical protein
MDELNSGTAFVGVKDILKELNKIIENNKDDSETKVFKDIEKFTQTLVFINMPIKEQIRVSDK